MTDGTADIVANMVQEKFNETVHAELFLVALSPAGGGDGLNDAMLRQVVLKRSKPLSRTARHSTTARRDDTLRGVDCQPPARAAAACERPSIPGLVCVFRPRRDSAGRDGILSAWRPLFVPGCTT